MYRESAVRGASPIGLIVILYDEIVRSLRKAQRAFEAGDIEARGRALTHAVEVIGYLQSILDFEKGGNVARELASFYNLMRGKLLEIHIAPSHEGLEIMAREFAKVGAAWQQAERSMSLPASIGSNAAGDARISSAASLAQAVTEANLVAMGR
jgi:flagellar protein FliS